MRLEVEKRTEAPEPSTVSRVLGQALEQGLELAQEQLQEKIKSGLAGELAGELIAQGLMPYVYSYGYYASLPLLKVTYFSDISLDDFKRLPRQFGGLPVEIAPATRARLEPRKAEQRFYPIEEAFSEAFHRAVAAGQESERALERAIVAARALLP